MQKSDYIMMSIFLGIGGIFTIIAIAVESTVATWIWGILAFAVFAFTIYATIDAIIKSRRKPKDFTELLTQYIKNEAKKPGFKEDFVKRMEANANRRDVLYESQRPSDEDFGYTPNNPIMTSTISRSESYLQSLRTLDGKSFTWQRLGSICMSEIGGVENVMVENVMVDKYQLFLDGSAYVIIYICPYGHSSSYVPKGLKLNQ